MNNDLREKRIVAYRNLTEDMQNLYGNLEMGDKLGVISNDLKLDEIPEGVLINIIGDIILGFNKKSDLKKLLKDELQVTDEVATKIESDLAQFLERIDTVPNDQAITEMVASEPDAIETTSAPEETPDDGPKPLTREDVLNALAPRKAPEVIVPEPEIVSEPEEPLSGYAAYQKEKEAEENTK